MTDVNESYDASVDLTHESAEQYYGTKVFQMGACNDLGELYVWEKDGKCYWCVDNTGTECSYPDDGKNEEDYNYVYEIPRSLFVELTKHYVCGAN